MIDFLMKREEKKRLRHVYMAFNMFPSSFFSRRTEAATIIISHLLIHMRFASSVHDDFFFEIADSTPMLKSSMVILPLFF